MSAKQLKEMFAQISEIVESNCGIADESGLILASTNDSCTGYIEDSILEHTINGDLYTYKGFTYKRLSFSNRYEYILFIKGDSVEKLKYLSLISLSIKNSGLYYDERLDKVNFVKNIMLNNVLPGDIMLRAKELHVSPSVKRVVFLIRTENVKDTSPYDIILSIFPNRNKDYIIVIDEENIALVKEFKSEDEEKITGDVERISRIIVDNLNSELMVKTVVGIGNPSHNIRDIARSYKEAQTALIVGSIFETDKSVVYYNNLGIGRLIYQLPTTLCNLFLKEVFSDDSLGLLDPETVNTIQKFFENNLNVSETSRQLYVHRNTLVYRLDKIQKLTGLDLRMFDDALTFKFSMMIKRYLDKTDKHS